MAEEKLLTIREVGIILGISEKEVIDLSETGEIPAYKIGGVYLRFKQGQIEEFKKSFRPVPQKEETTQKYSTTSSPVSQEGIKDKLSDFFYFNDFYILSILIILLVLVIIFRGY